MNLEKYVVISGMSGVHKLITTRNNGVIIEDIKLKRNRFAPIRGNAFTALGTVSVFVDSEEGAIPLADVFTKMNDSLEAHPLPGSKEHSSVQRAYFKAVVPEHDETQVHINDIKKIVKWFGFMQENGLIEEAIASQVAAEEAKKAEETAEAAEAAEESTTEE